MCFSQLNVQELRFLWGMIKDICEENITIMDDKLVYLVTDYALEESLKLNDVPFTSADILITLGPKHFVPVSVCSIMNENWVISLLIYDF